MTHRTTAPDDFCGASLRLRCADVACLHTQSARFQHDLCRPRRVTRAQTVSPEARRNLTAAHSPSTQLSTARLAPKTLHTAKSLRCTTPSTETWQSSLALHHESRLGQRSEQSRRGQAPYSAYESQPHGSDRDPGDATRG
jgi:hypothetical protein